MNTASDFAWLTEHSLELNEKYKGKWIAVHMGEVIAVGDSAVEADAEARRKCPERDYLIDRMGEPVDVVYHTA